MSEHRGGVESSQAESSSVGRLEMRIDLPKIEEIEVVVVDDEGTSLTLLEAAVARIGHPVRSFTDADDAARHIDERPPQILVTDMVMPGMTGVDLARLVRSHDPDARVILVTGYGDERTAEVTYDLGVTTYLPKPVALADLSHAVRHAYLQYATDKHHRERVNWAYESMARNENRIREVTLGTLTALMNAMDARSPHFAGHSRAVALEAAAIAETLGLDEDTVEQVRTAGLLHDIGMIGVPDSVIDKPATLSESEAELIRQHPETGAAILSPMKHLEAAITYILHHHERLDGSGYPDGLKGDEISLGGQIVGIAEAWSGLVEGRAYQEGRSQEEALEVLRMHEGRWFGADVTEALAECDLGLIV